MARRDVNARGRREQREGEAVPDSPLPDQLFTGWLLTLIARKPLHGYAVAKEMAKLPCAVPHQTTIYRHLASLEDDGLLDSRWDMRSSAPPIRTYHLTDRGRGELRRIYSAVSHLQRLCRAFLSEASEHM